MKAGLRLVGIPPEEAVSRTGRDGVLRLLAAGGELSSAFQQIVSLRDGFALGFEALLRLPPTSGFSGTQEAFDAASGTDLLVDFEMAALETHLASASPLRDGLLFLNVSARSLLDGRLQPRNLTELIARNGLCPERIVLELTELVRVADPSEFSKRLAPLRSAGFDLALDDFGAGFSDLRLLLELSPEFVKIDRSLVQGASMDHRRRLFLESIETLSRRIGCTVIAEGVETSEDVEICRACGIPFAQGWALAYPGPAASVLPARGLRIPLPRETMLAEEAVGSLSLPLEPVDPNQSVGSLLNLFEASPNLHAVAVVSGNRPVGLLSRDFLFLHIVNAYGFSLWRDRPVARLLEDRGSGFEALPASATLEEASAVVQGRPASRRYQPVVIVTGRGEYHGLLPVDLLLSEMTRLKLDYALQSNPLTKLPGSRLLERSVERHFDERRPFSLGWADLDDFKSFNDYYGFSRGDRVLLLAAEVLHRHLGGGGNGPLVHLGGDDFAFLLPPDGDEETAWRISREFSSLVPALYDESERLLGGLEIEDRQGVRRFRPFSALSIGLVRWDGEPGVSYQTLSELAAEMKSLSKRTEGPSVAVNGRALTGRRSGRPS